MAGQIFASAVDLGLQQLVFSKIENALSGIGFFDIFAMRTSFFQKMIENYYSSTSVSLGDFLDQSSLYFGSYLGDFAYLDFLIHVEKYNSKITVPLELGFELKGPPLTFLPNSSLDFRWSYALEKNMTNLRGGLGISFKWFPK